MQRFAEKLNIFQLNKLLIVLCHCGSVWQKGVYDTLKVPPPTIKWYLENKKWWQDNII